MHLTHAQLLNKTVGRISPSVIRQNSVQIIGLRCTNPSDKTKKNALKKTYENRRGGITTHLTHAQSANKTVARISLSVIRQNSTQIIGLRCTNPSDKTKKNALKKTYENRRGGITTHLTHAQLTNKTVGRISLSVIRQNSTQIIGLRCTNPSDKTKKNALKKTYENRRGGITTHLTHAQLANKTVGRISPSVIRQNSAPMEANT